MASCETPDMSEKKLVGVDKDPVPSSNQIENGKEEGDQEDYVEDEEVDEEEEEEGTETGDTLDIHPLQNKWALWFYKNDRGNSWTDNLKKVVEFGTVEDFWGIVNHVSPASSLPTGCDYSLFKVGIQPMWEDAANRNGGRWLIALDKGQRNTILDGYWLDILMLLIGEAFDEDSDDICGAVVNIRNKGDRLSVWTANCESTDAIMRIGKKIKAGLNLRVQISYQSHDDQQNRTGSKAKSTFLV